MRASIGTAAALAVAALWGAPAAAQPDGRGALAESPRVDDLGLERMIGMTVHDVAGEGFGVVTDVVIDMATHRVRYAEVSPGRDPSRRLAVLPGQMWVANGDPGVVQTPIPDARLVLGVREPSLERPPAAPLERPVVPGAPPLQRPVRGSELLDAPVAGPDGERVGTIRDVVIDLDSGRLRQVVLSLGGWPWSDTVAVTAQSILAPRDGGAWTVAMTAERLERLRLQDPDRASRPRD